MRRGDYKVFDKVYASHRMGVMKPDPAFFRYILRAEQCSPEKGIFIDDLEDNVSTAVSMGIRAIHFRSYEELLVDLFDTRGSRSSAERA